MPRYVALLRGVSPLNAKMPELKRCFERAGFTDVATVLSSGNVVFTSRRSTDTALEKKIEAAMQEHLGKVFYTIVRRADALAEMLEADPFSRHRLKPGSKRVVSFVRKMPARLKLPLERDGARVLAAAGRELFSAYVRSPKGPVFMLLIEETAGKQVTTRTWETIRKLVTVARGVQSA